MSETNDLFGDDGAHQLSLFGEGANRMQPPVQSYSPDPLEIRRRLYVLLGQARNATVMPWPEGRARMWQVTFPQMANWLADQDEANQLRFEFARELERLKAA